ncbi:MULTISPECIES: hypothetical protein [Bacillus cereus group]|uniref:hypothetical protein n=1 Tax=Bacillus cereus group TaxID=86661 RepID=UPI000C2858C1|nr:MULTISPECIES: hypothetical protein [Bacillus cereus group]MCC2420467.1 hypothetical protein [Bacillus wiedmannii]
MLRGILPILTVPLVVIHFVILYFWIFDWRKLNTQVGLINWGVSIVLGIFIYFVYRKLDNNKKNMVMSRTILISSTGMVIFLGVVALGIACITSSMP